MRTESGSIAEVSHLAYIYRFAKYDISNKNDTIFQLCRRTISQTGSLSTDISSFGHLGVEHGNGLGVKFNILD